MASAADQIRADIAALLPRLRRFARALTGEAADADDVVQIALERALVRAEQFQPGTRLDAWLYAIVRNAWIDEARARTRRAKVFAPAELGERVGSNGEAEMLAKLEASDVWSAMAALPEEQREAVALVCVEGLAYREAAAALGVPIGTLTSPLGAWTRGAAARARRRSMSVDDDKLMAFADGELAPAERAEIEQALAQDPALRERIAAHLRLRADLLQAYAGALDERVPQHLRDMLEPPQQQSAEIVQLGERRAAAWSMREWGAMAASLAAGLLLAFGAIGANPPMIAATNHGLAARGALAAALDRQLAADEGRAVRIGLSFRAQDGAYCRTFDLTRNDVSGLACRRDDGWRIDMAAVHTAGGEVRMAGAAPEIMAAVDARIAGEPLDAAAERRARDGGWR